MAKIEQPVPGLFFDELSKIRVLESDSATQTNELKEECQDFVDSKLIKHHRHWYLQCCAIFVLCRQSQLLLDHKEPVSDQYVLFYLLIRVYML